MSNEAISKIKSAGLALTYPFEWDIITDWERFKEILCHAFATLNVSSGDYEVLITEPPVNPKNNCEKITNILFKDFNVKGVHIATQKGQASYPKNAPSLILIKAEIVSKFVMVIT